MTVFEFVGWIGSALFIISYLLLSIQRMDANKVPYQLMNVLGGLCLVICAYGSQDGPNFFTNLVWMGIGIYAIVVILRRRNKP